MPTVYLNIGSNKGHRHALIERAVTLISGGFREAVVRKSSYIETVPWGFESSNNFLNIGLSLYFVCDIDAGRILGKLQSIEKCISPESHRNSDGTYRDRCIDIDIIAIDTIKLDLPNLKIPHPHAHERDFVMTPLRELAPSEVVDFVLHQSHA